MALASMLMDPAAIPKAKFIVPFSGLLTEIPTGWQLCDGTSGTPDLRDRFVVGAAAGQNPGASGGGGTHTHVGHAAHLVTQPSNHAATATGQASAGATQRGTNASTLTLGVHTHQTPVLAHSGTGVDAHSAHDNPDSRPPYYALAWIMKL